MEQPALTFFGGDFRRGRRAFWQLWCGALDVEVTLHDTEVESALGLFLAELRLAASRVDPATASATRLQAAAWVTFCATPDAIELALECAPVVDAAECRDAEVLARYEAGGYAVDADADAAPGRG